MRAARAAPFRIRFRSRASFELEIGRDVQESRPEDGDDGAVRHRELDVVERDEPPVGDREALDLALAQAAEEAHDVDAQESALKDAAAERPRAVEAACWMLLRRYGIVIRDLLARESNLPPWRELLAGFRWLEDRGEIRGGRFVDGFLGEQFALPVAVESVRAMRNLALSGETMTLSAADPLNLVGILVPGERVPAISGKSVSFRDGVATIATEPVGASEVAAG